MPRPKKGARLGSNPAHQKLMISNLAVSLFEHESITTTEAKAKVLRPFAEKMITKAKKGSVQDRRVVLRHIEDRDIVHKLFSDIGPRFAERNGGYTRILKLGPRNGDGAPMALIELVEGEAVVGGSDDDAPSTSRRRIRRPGSPKASASEPETEATETEATAEAEADEQPETDEQPEAPEAEAETEVAAEAPDTEADTETDTETPGDADSETSQDEPGDTEKDS